MSASISKGWIAAGRIDRLTSTRRAASGKAPLLLLLIACLSGVAVDSAHAQCQPDPPASDDMVTCDGASTGFDVPDGVDGLTVVVEPTATLDESDPVLDAAIDVNDGNTVVTLRDSGDPSITSIITVTEDGGIGIRGGLDNLYGLDGTIDVNADNAHGVLSGGISSDTATSILDLNRAGVINVMGNNSTALEASTEDITVSAFGTINLNGDNNRGIVVGNRSTFTQRNFIRVDGTVNVGGSDPMNPSTGSIGILAGDGWYPPDIDGGSADPNFSSNSLTNGIIALERGGLINVNSVGGYGIRAGDDANLVGNNNSVVFLGGTIDLIATDSIGVSIGGNDFDPNLPDKPFSLRNFGSIVGTNEMHGPLVEFRAFSSGDNFVINDVGSSILANLNLQGTPGRAIAIMGTDGIERVDNNSTIRGDVFLGGGNDLFQVISVPGQLPASFTGTLDTADGNDAVLNDGLIVGDVLLGAGDDLYTQTSIGVQNGVIDGGAGVSDTVLLQGTFGSIATFDISQMTNFEMLRMGDGTPWILTNGDLYTGMTHVEAGGTLIANDPLVLGGPLDVNAGGTLELRLDDTTPALTIMGDAAFNGDLVVTNDPNLSPDPNNPYLLIDVGGSRNGTEFTSYTFATSSSRRRFTPLFVGEDLFVRLELLSLVETAETPNQLAVAQHLTDIESDPNTPPELTQLLIGLENASGSIAPVFDALGPEAYDAQTSVIVEAGRQITKLLLDRPRECQPGRYSAWSDPAAPLPCHARKWSPWFAVTGTFRSRDKFKGHPRYDASLGGLVFGIDARPLGGLDMTFAVSSQRGSVDVANAESSTLTMTDVSGHVGYTYGPLRVQSAVSWGHTFHRNRRLIEYPNPAGNPTSLRAEKEHDSDRISVAGEMGLHFDVGPIGIEPIASVDWAWLNQRSISESNAGLIGLRVESRDDDVGSVSAGLRATTEIQHNRYFARNLEWMDGVWRPQLDVRWREFLAGTKRKIDARLRGAPANVPGFTIEGEEDDGGLEIGAAVSFVPENANRLQIDLRYEAFVASHTLEQDLSLRLQLSF